ncbi:MAG TPA: hypothetical protein VN458_09785 [Solirubrobacterales bacterium]|nr:hypothetical protein [Solirubrobacterales bacterium]
MSQENVEIVRRAYEAFNQDGADALTSTGLWSPELVLDASGTGIPGIGIYRGIKEVKGPGAELELANIITLRDGVIVRTDMYRDRAEALEAAGLQR